MKYGYSKVFEPPRVNALYTDDLKEARRVGNKLVRERGFTPHVNNPVYVPHYREGEKSLAGTLLRGWYEIWSEERYGYDFGPNREPSVRIYIHDPKHYDAEEGGE